MPDLPAVLTVACWNTHTGGIDPNGNRQRLHRAIEVLAALRPHLVLQQETRWQPGAADRLDMAARLGLVSCAAPPIPESHHLTGVMYDPAVFAMVAGYVHTTRMWHAVANPVLRLHGTAKPLSVASVHLCFHDPAARAAEAQRLTILADHGRSALFGGDMNSYVHREDDERHPLPDWSQVHDPVHYQQRTIWRGGKRVSDSEPDRILAATTPGGRAVFVELGHHAATALGQPGALTPTASLWRTDQGPAQRIDRLYATPDTATALLRLGVLITDDVRAVSDHALLVAHFDHAALRRTLTPPTTVVGQVGVHFDAVARSR